MLFFTGNLVSQPTNIGIGVNLGTNFFFGDFPDISISDSRLMPNVGLYYFHQITSQLTLKLQMGYGQLKSLTNDVSFKSSIIPMEITGMYSLFKSKLNPIITGGLGFFDLHNQGSFSLDGVFVSSGFGINVTLNPRFSLLTTADFKYTSEDKFNGIIGGFKDGYFSFQSGLSYCFGEDKKTFKKNDHHRNSIIATEAASIDIVTIYDSTQIDPNTDLAILQSQIQSLEKVIQDKDNQIIDFTVQLTELDSSLTDLELQLIGPKYREALNKFRAQKYKEAIRDFEELSLKYPDHSLGSNFVYWIGESNFAIGDFKHALSAFEKVSTYSTSTKFDDALYMAGRCYQKMGEDKKAIQKFNELFKHHPIE